MNSEVPRRTLIEWRKKVYYETQAEFAARLGVKPSTVSSWERTEGQKTPRLRNRRAIAKALGVRVDQIIWPGDEPDEESSEGKDNAAKAA